MEERVKIGLPWLRLLGVVGALGGIVMFAGDMLFYYRSEATDIVLNMGMDADLRIVLSAVTALVGTWFYVLGAVPVAFAFGKTTALARNTVVACFVAIFIAYGIVHGAYVAIAATAKLAVQHQLDLDEATALAIQANDAMRLLIYPIFAILSVVFISQVWKRKTLYPRWMILFFPLIPFLFQGFVSEILSGTAWVVVAGGYLNWILTIFFVASTIALWNPDVEVRPVQVPALRDQP
jgi:hypothetical protein